MSVWYVLPAFPSPTETFAGTDLRALRELGASVRVINLRRSHPEAARLLREWALDGLEIDECHLRNWVTGLGWMTLHPTLVGRILGTIFQDNWRRPVQVLKSLALLPRLFDVHRALTAAPPDVLHLFWGHFPALLGLMVRWTHPEVVVTLFLGAYDLRTHFATSATLAGAADAVFTHARANLQLLAQRGIDPDRVVVVWRGVDLRRLRFDGGPKIPLRIATVGALLPAKGMGDVLTAFGAIQRGWPEASLDIIGDGPERVALEERARGEGLARVRFTGHLSHGEVFAALCRAEVFLFLSRQDVLPNVVKEAIAARCACVVSQTLGIEELVAPGEQGDVVPPGDTDAAAAAVGRLFSEATRRQEYVIRAGQHLEARFDVKESMRRYIAVWQAARASRDSRATRFGAAPLAGKPDSGGPART